MKDNSNYGLAIHGGTGSFSLNNIDNASRKLYGNFFKTLIENSYTNLSKGANCVDIVEKVICKMEDSGYFNAGQGSISLKNSYPSMDASIMNGENLSFGSITNIGNVKNPISIARKIMNEFQGYYSFKKQEEFEKFSKDIESVDRWYFKTDKLWLKLIDEVAQKKNSTVGCVVLDKFGNLAAGTSTGGLTVKEKGRISDSSYIGAGTYANNKSCALSCSGHGETIMKILFAHSIHSRMLFLKLPLCKAVDSAFAENTHLINYNVGVIGIDSLGNIVAKHNSKIMFYAYKSSLIKYSSFVVNDT